MKLRSITPGIDISSYVSDIVVLEDDHLGDCVIPLIAKGYPSIVFQSTSSGKNISYDRLVLYGQNIKPYDFHATGHLKIIAYFLYPHILKHFFGFDANEITDCCIELSTLRQIKKGHLKEQLINASSLNMRLQLLDSYILKLAELALNDINKPILFATRAIQKSNGLVSLRNIQNELRITERTFQRLFKSHVGVSPKTYSRICQFNLAFLQINNSEFLKLGDVAHRNGYTDQSHLIRAFKEFTNYSPKEYLKRSSDFRE